MRSFKKQKALLLLMYQTFGQKPRDMGIGFYRNSIALSTIDEEGNRFIPMHVPAGQGNQKEAAE